MKKLIVLLAVAALVAGGVYVLKSRKALLEAARPPAPLPAIVDTVKITGGGGALTIPAMGTVSSDQSVTLSTKITGRVIHVFRKEGDRVRKGDLIAEVDAAELQAKRAATQQQKANLDYEIASKQASLEALRVALANAQESHGRTKELLEVKGASIEQAQTEETQIAAIQAQIDALRNAIASLHDAKLVFDHNLREADSLLGYTRVVSPIDGTLAVRHVQEGDMAMPGKPLFYISGDNGLYLSLRLPSDLAAREILWDGRRLPLVPRNLASQSGLVEYRSPVPASAKVVEGQMVQASVITSYSPGPLIPFDTLLSVNSRDYVFVFDGGKVEKQQVTITHRGVEGVHVREALSGKTILSGMPDILLRVSSGVPVRINSIR